MSLEDRASGAPAPPVMRTASRRLLVGLRREMSHTADSTGELWRAFRARIPEVANRATGEMISMRVYSGAAQDVYDPEARFSRWAAVEVADLDHVPVGMEPYTLEGGSYAVFTHRGPASDVDVFRYIFAEWLPASAYVLASREHFEVLPAGYDPFAADATEEIWVPVEPQKGGA
jgi:AraC family transcriptional regulator